MRATQKKMANTRTHIHIHTCRHKGRGENCKDIIIIILKIEVKETEMEMKMEMETTKGLTSGDAMHSHVWSHAFLNRMGIHFQAKALNISNYTLYVTIQQQITVNAFCVEMKSMFRSLYSNNKKCCHKFTFANNNDLFNSDRYLCFSKLVVVVVYRTYIDGGGGCFSSFLFFSGYQALKIFTSNSDDAIRLK